MSENSSIRKKSIISLPEDCTYEIIQQLPEETSILYKFLFVNRFWCKCIVSILWKYPFNKISDDRVKHACLINTYLGCLNEEEKSNIERDHCFKLPSTEKPFFNYAKYLMKFTINELDSLVRTWYTNHSYCDLTDNVKHIVSSIYHLFIRSNNHLLSLEFKQGWIHTWNWEKVLNDTIRLSSLKKLNIELHEDLKEGGGDYKISDLEFFNILLSKCTNLQTLEMYFTIHGIQEEYVKYFSSNQIIKMIRSQKNLEILNISNFYQYGTELTKIISSLESQLNSLKELQFYDVNFMDCSLIGLKICSNLESIIFNSCYGLTNDHCNSLSNSSFKLKSLYFYDQTINQDIITNMLSIFGGTLTNFGTSILTNNIIETASIRCQNVKYLTIIIEGDEHYQPIFSWINNLELIELDITSYIQETSEFFQLLGYKLPNTLKILKLGCSYVTDDSLKNLFSSRMDLERLTFRNLYEFNYDCLMVIYEYIRYYKNFKELSFKTYKKKWSLRDLKVLKEIKRYCPLVNCEFEISTVEEMLDECFFEDLIIQFD